MMEENVKMKLNVVPTSAGGSNKAKLVDVAVIKEELQDGLYHYNAALENGKCYMLVCNEDSWGTYTNCIISKNENSAICHQLIYVVSDHNDNNGVGVLYLDNSDKTIRLDYLMDDVGNNADNGSCYMFGEIKIYELPFSL